MTLGKWISLLFLVWCLFLAVNDLRFRRVPNVLIVTPLAVAVGIMVLASRIPGALQASIIITGPVQALTGFFAGLIIFYPLWRFRAMGAGDVKLIAVFGFLFGLHGLLPVLLLGSVLAGLHAIGMVMRQGLGRLRRQWREEKAGRRGVPYAAHLSIAALVWVFWLEGVSSIW